MSMFSASPAVIPTGPQALRRDDAHLRELYGFLTMRRPTDHESALARGLLHEERQAQRKAIAR